MNIPWKWLPICSTATSDRSTALQRKTIRFLPTSLEAYLSKPLSAQPCGLVRERVRSASAIISMEMYWFASLVITPFTKNALHNGFEETPAVPSVERVPLWEWPEKAPFSILR